MMKTQKRYMLLALVAIVFTAASLSSCIFGGGMSKEECLDDYRENFLPYFMDHVKENEEIYIKLAESLSEYVIGLDDINGYRTVSLSKNYRAQNDDGEGIKYELFISRRPNPYDRSEAAQEDIDFLNDSAINIYNLTEEDLDIVFSRYRRVYCDSLLNDERRGSSIGFEGLFAATYNKADRVDTMLWYSKTGGYADSPNSINDHWIITYSLYWSPAI